MCGIVGALSFTGSSIDRERLVQMRDTLRHRGPDGAGVWLSPDARVGLAHRRLSIIDLSAAAAQPMANEDGSIQLVFNGEIYNHAEIRAELARGGRHQWRTDHSDSEMILHAYEEWGIDCVQRFRGMFAVALWDGRNRRLWLVRDRIGIKPIYHTTVAGRFLFASEIKALLADPDVPRRVNHGALFDYLSFLTAPAPETLFDGIYKLPPATRMCVEADGRIRTERYWDVLDHVEDLRGLSEDAIAERLLAELATAVRYRKVSDVPVGVFLSGGIDSSANTALFSDGTGPVKTFSIGYDGEYASYQSELPHAARMAALVGAEHHVRRLNVDDLLSFVPSMVYHQDEPIGDVVCVPLYYVSKLARDAGVIVCQVGEGSDELFCGYPRWKKNLLAERMNRWPVPALAKRAGMAALSFAGRGDGYEYECLRRATRREPLFWGGAEGLTNREKHRLLSADLRGAFDGRSSADALHPILARFRDKAADQAPLNWMSYLDLNLRLPELLLMRVDKMTMATSLEGRVPFLDHKFVEFAMSIPAGMKLRSGNLKHILKRAVRGRIPDDVIERPKQGFGVPLDEWLMGRLGDTIRQRIERFCERSGLLDIHAARAFLASAKPSKSWQLLNLALWYDCFIDRAPAPPVAADWRPSA